MVDACVVPSTHAILHACKTNFNAGTFRIFLCGWEGGGGARFNSICKLT